MRPSRYIPSQTSTKKIIDNLAYVMHTMLSRNVHSDTYGIGFLANMDDWTMKNFDVDYCYQFMMTLQGYVIPVRVQLFLIVNPPSWFDVIWKIMKPMLVPSFRKKVKMIPQSELNKYLQEDYLQYLPNDGMNGIGQADTNQLVEDFVSYRKYIDEIQNPKSYEWEPTSKSKSSKPKRGSATTDGNTATKPVSSSNDEEIIDLDIGVTSDGNDDDEEPEFSTMFTQVLHEELKCNNSQIGHSSMSTIEETMTTCNNSTRGTAASRPNSRSASPLTIPMSPMKALKGVVAANGSSTKRKSATTTRRGRRSNHPQVLSWSRM